MPGSFCVPWYALPFFSKGIYFGHSSYQYSRSLVFYYPRYVAVLSLDYNSAGYKWYNISLVSFIICFVMIFGEDKSMSL
jgi:hypothetical protein